MNVLPWQTEAFTALQRRRQAGNLPHALLLTGPEGIGRRHFADALAASLLCLSPQADGRACGACQACLLRQAGTHPDLLILSPEESSVIRIDQIRELIEHLSLSRHHAAWRVVIIDPAEAMNVAAGNALLKTLEEPPPETLLILLASRPARLPATIRSRCQRLSLTQPPRAAALAWLREQGADGAEALLDLAGGAPVAALALGQEALARHGTLFRQWIDLAAGRADPVKLAAEWIKPDAERPIQWIQAWVGDMIRLRQGARARQAETEGALQNLAGAIDLVRLHRLLDRVQEARRLLGSQVNEQTILEGILIYWANLPRQAST